jgi:hypothetical protein
MSDLPKNQEKVEELASEEVPSLTTEVPNVSDVASGQAELDDQQGTCCAGFIQSVKVKWASRRRFPKRPPENCATCEQFLWRRLPNFCSRIWLPEFLRNVAIVAASGHCLRMPQCAAIHRRIGPTVQYDISRRNLASFIHKFAEFFVSPQSNHTDLNKMM